MSRTDSSRLAQPFPRTVEVDKPEGEAYRLVSVAPPLGESGAPLLEEVLAELAARGETEVQLHLDVVTNHFVSDPRLDVGQATKEFLVLDLALARELLRR
jgi:hypothetical protein